MLSGFAGHVGPPAVSGCREPGIDGLAQASKYPGTGSLHTTLRNQPSPKARGPSREIRRSVLERSLRSDRSEARRTVSSVALAIFWRMRGEVQQSGTVAPGRERYGSGLRDRSADFERSWMLTSIPASAAPLAASWQSAFCTCGFWRKPPCRRCAMSGPRPSWHSFGGELGHAPVENRSILGQSRRVACS